ncbi:MAG TPA: carboxypeptidase regulatory-like domain-containing protein [Kofleriaceae bacterium]|nr:carboxypeptidase regulatory-like domain-containing protein [Kofleriaceae bacterium]
MKRRNLLLALAGLALLVGAWWWLRGRGGGGDSAEAGGTAAAGAPAGSSVRAPHPDPTSPPRARIRGTVRDDKGTGIAGATVCANAYSDEISSEEDQLPHCALSAAGGVYLIGELAPARYQVSGSAPQRMPGAWKDGDGHGTFRLAAGEERAGIDLVLPGGGVALRGVVSDIGGGPVAEAWVAASSERGEAWAAARADADGKFTLWVRPGSVWAAAEAEGYAKARKRWTAPSDKLELLMTPESVLAGRVVEAGTDTPVAGAMVSAQSWNDGDGGDGSDRTDADGRFRITRLSPGRYKPQATADGRWGEARASVLLGLGQTVEDVVIEVHPAFMVTGKVVIDDGNGATRPCERGNVSLQDSARDHGDAAEIGPGGQVRMRALFPGTYEVTVDCTDQLAAEEYPPVVVADADVADQVWTVGAGATVVVAVTGTGGRPIAGADVRLEARKRTRRSGWSSEETDAAGQVRLRGLVPGGYLLHVDTDDHLDPEPRPVEVAAGEQRFEVALADGGSIHGVVVDAAGAPVPGATVLIRGDRWSGWGWRRGVLTGDDGSFRLDGLAAGETRVVATRGWQEMRRPGAGDDDVQGESVKVADGVVAEVRLVVESQSERITGTVVDHTGAVVTDAFVAAQRESEAAGADRGQARRALRWGGWERQAIAVDGEGKFTIDHLSPGTYTVRAYRRGGGEGISEGVKAGGSARLVIRPTTSLAGRVSLAGGGGAPERFEVSLQDEKTGFEREESFFRTGGAFTLTDLPAGAFKVSAQAAEGSALADLALAEGEQRTGLALELEGRVTLTGRVVELGSGKPVEGARIWANALRGSARAMGDWDDPRRITDGDGRFTVERAPRGLLQIYCMPETRESPYMGGRKLITVPADASSFDVGDVEMLVRRLPPRSRPGDLGFTMVQPPPDQDPDETRLQVASIRRGGPAEGTGLAVGDVIITVDGMDVTGANAIRWWGLGTVAPGTTIKLGLARGTAIAITAGKPM